MSLCSEIQTVRYGSLGSNGRNKRLSTFRTENSVRHQRRLAPEQERLTPIVNDVNDNTNMDACSLRCVIGRIDATSAVITAAVVVFNTVVGEAPLETVLPAMITYETPDAVLDIILQGRDALPPSSLSSLLPH